MTKFKAIEIANAVVEKLIEVKSKPELKKHIPNNLQELFWYYNFYGYDTLVKLLMSIK